MRLRRETGDFSIVIDGTADTANCQIRRGLAAEDLIGAVVQTGVAMGVVTGTEKNTDTGAIILKCADAVLVDGTFVYNPDTGIVKYTKTV